MSTAKMVVVAVLAGAVAFGLFIGYLAYVNLSFPVKAEPFGNYAQVDSVNFNGTEIAFHVTWKNSSALPLYAQVTSPSSDAANTAVCDLGLASASDGQSIFLPFAISPTSATLSDLHLRIAVEPLAGGPRFTISYDLLTIPAANTPINPPGITCQQPAGIQ